MNWNNLHQGRCPKCGAGLEHRPLQYGVGYVCVSVYCDFVIGEDKMHKIVNKSEENIR